MKMFALIVGLLIGLPATEALASTSKGESSMTAQGRSSSLRQGKRKGGKKRRKGHPLAPQS